MPCNLNWDAINAFATSAAVIVALFGERGWKYWNRPQPRLKLFDRKDMADHASLTLLSVENPKDVIMGAKIFLVAYCYKKDGRQVKKRVLPAEFEWLKNTEMKSEGESRPIFGEEAFPFLVSRRQESNLWSAELRAYLLPADDPFEDSKGNPNFEVVIYLQLKATNFVSKFWPVRVTYDAGTAGGWVSYPLEPIEPKEFLETFPNLAENHFKTATNRLHQ